MKSTLAKILLLGTAFTAAAVTFQEWRSAVFSPSQLLDVAVSGPNADPDYDGAVNLVEFAVGGNPLSRTSVEQPQSTLDGTGHLRLTFSCRRLHPGVLILPQVSGNLQAPWQSGSDYIEELSVQARDSETDWLTVRDLLGKSDTTQRFIRVLVADDADNDGLPDSWELANGLSPLDASDANGDLDGDGHTNAQEFADGGDALDPENFMAKSMPNWDAPAYEPPTIVNLRAVVPDVEANVTDPDRTTIDLRWDAIKRTDVSAISVERAEGWVGFWEQVAHLSFGATSCAQQNLKSCITYRYRLVLETSTEGRLLCEIVNYEVPLLRRIEARAAVAIGRTPGPSEDVTYPHKPTKFRRYTADFNDEWSESRSDTGYSHSWARHWTLTYDVARVARQAHGIYHEDWREIMAVPDQPEDSFDRSGRTDNTGTQIDSTPARLNGSFEATASFSNGDLSGSGTHQHGFTIQAVYPWQFFNFAGLSGHVLVNSWRHDWSGTSEWDEDVDGGDTHTHSHSETEPNDNGHWTGTYISTTTGPDGTETVGPDPIDGMREPYGAGLGTFQWRAYNAVGAEGAWDEGEVTNTCGWGSSSGESDEDGLHTEWSSDASWTMEEEFSTAELIALTHGQIPQHPGDFFGLYPGDFNDWGGFGGCAWKIVNDPVWGLGASDEFVSHFGSIGESDSATWIAWRRMSTDETDYRVARGQYRVVINEPHPQPDTLPEVVLNEKFIPDDDPLTPNIDESLQTESRQRVWTPSVGQLVSETFDLDPTTADYPWANRNGTVSIGESRIVLYDDSINSPTVAWSGESIKLVQVQGIPEILAAAVIANGGTAWIRAHALAVDPDPALSDGADSPVMPELVARLRDGPADQQVQWRLRVRYTRGNGAKAQLNLPEDIVDLPGRANGNAAPGPANQPGWTAPMPANQDWRIFDSVEWVQELVQRGFFGGEADLYCWIAGQPEPAHPQLHFNIGGNNPDDVRCRCHIESQPDANPTGNLWFAYGIARSESADYNGDASRYNQFWEVPIYNRQPRVPGRPIWHDDNNQDPLEPGGYGIFQVTLDTRGGHHNHDPYFIPRTAIWHWQHNVREAMIILRRKRGLADTWMTRQRNQQNANGTALPNHTVGTVTFSEGTLRPMNNAVTMKAYNGAVHHIPNIDHGVIAGFRLDTSRGDHYCYWDNLNAAWALSRFNNLGFNYVERVCIEIGLEP